LIVIGVVWNGKKTSRAVHDILTGHLDRRQIEMLYDLLHYEARWQIIRA
jgi:hypothetical protein